MHVLKNKLWSELEKIEMEEKSQKGELGYHNLEPIYKLAKAYVYLCKACEYHERYGNSKEEPMESQESAMKRKMY